MALAEKVDTGPYEMRWGPILSGSFVSLGIWMFLNALGAAIGGASNRGFSSWTAVYVLVAPIIALFFGGMIVARGLVVSVSRASSALHAAAVWGFSMVIGAFLIGTLGILGVSAMLQQGGMGAQNVNIPSGYSWAIAGSILFSLIAALLGSSIVPHERVRRTQIPIRRETET